MVSHFSSFVKSRAPKVRSYISREPSEAQTQCDDHLRTYLTVSSQRRAPSQGDIFHQTTAFAHSAMLFAITFFKEVCAVIQSLPMGPLDLGLIYCTSPLF